MAQTFHEKIIIEPDLLKVKDRENWQAVVAQDLQAIWTAHTGRALLNQILGSPNPVKIIPFYKQEENADATPRDFRKATFAKEPVRDGNDGHHEAQWGIGTSEGSAVLVRFTPWRFRTDHYASIPPDLRRVMTTFGLEPGDSNDHVVVLLHELVHASQQQRGQMASKRLTHGFDTTAEFDAILVENIFRSETGRYLRQSHHGFEVLKGKDMLPPQELKERIDGFRARSPQLAAALGRVNAPFNPLAPAR